ncbi:MAG: AraC family transcriptional regulator [Rhizobium sp.]
MFQISDNFSVVPERDIVRRDGAGTTACIVQSTRLLCKRLASPAPGIVLVQKGQKIVLDQGAEMTARVGDLVLIPEGATSDIINEPDGPNGYQALALQFAPNLIAELAVHDARPVQNVRVLNDMPPAFEEAYRKAVEAIRSGPLLPDSIAASRVNEILLWLGAQGHRFAPIANPGPIERLRRIITSDPAYSWRAPDLARAIGMSEASLRRKLAATGTSFSELLADIRMTTALTLLQTTEKSVTQIALDVGYDSASRFTARFRARFEFAPSEIRGHRRELDRNGAKTDRNSAALVPAE